MAAVEFNPQQLADVQDLLSQIKGGAAKAIRMAANRACSTTQSYVVKAVAEHITAPQREIRDSMSSTKATAGGIVARITIKGKHIPLYDFDWSYYGSVFPNKRRRISIKVRTDKGREQWLHAFLMRTPQGHVGIFERKTATTRRLPVRELFGPSVPNVFLFAQQIEPVAMSIAAGTFALELDRAANYLLQQQLASMPDE